MQFPTEAEIELRLTGNFRQPGFVVLSASAQNIDRMVSIYRACKRSDRTLLLDLRAMEILRATGNEHLPNVSWPNISVYVPEYQRRQIARRNVRSAGAVQVRAHLPRAHHRDRRSHG